MGDWVEVAEENSFRRQARVQAGDKILALFRLEDGVYATDDTCSHEYSPLSEGEIWDEEVFCPKHGSRFDIKSGEVRSFPATRPISTYPVKVEDGRIFVKVEE